MDRAVFFDRDNTLIHNDGDLGDPARVRMIQGAASAIASLRGLGYKIVVISNQGGVARGKFSEADVEKTNAKIDELVRESSGAWIDRFYYCPFHPEGTVEKYKREHEWRKPQPGMVLQAARDMRLDLTQCWMIGDQMRDIQAGKAAGVRTILLEPDAGEQPPLRQQNAAAELFKEDNLEVVPDFVARNIIEAVRIVAQQRRPEVFDERWGDETPRGRGGVGMVVKKIAVPPPPGMQPRREPSRDASTTDGGQGHDLSQFRGEPQHTVAATPVASAAGSAAVVSPPPIAPHPTSAPAPVTPQAVRAAAEPVAVQAPPPRPIIHPPPPSPAVAPPATPEPAPHVMVTQPPPAAADAPPTSTVNPSTTNEQLLRQILNELRTQRTHCGEAAPHHILAIVLQLIAIICLAGAFMLGSLEKGTFLQFGLGAVVLQLATIATLLFKPRS